MNEEEIQHAFDVGDGYIHMDTQVVEEHGSMLVVCNSCGASWSVHDSESGPVFKMLDEGDEWCMDEHNRKKGYNT